MRWLLIPLVLLAQTVATEVALLQIAGFPPTRNEVPLPAAALPGGTASTWTLKRAPTYGAACYRNGVRQMPGLDYTLTGSSLTSPSWQPGDTLLCDY